MPVQTLTLVGFAPDVSTSILPGQGQTPAAFIDCDGFYPSMAGMTRCLSPVLIYPALPTRVTPSDLGAAYGYYVARFLDGSTKLFAGTRTALYRGQSGVWTSVSPPMTNFATPDRCRWRFDMFGNDCIAVNGFNVPQIITDTGSTFAALAGIPPVAKVVCVGNPGGSGAFVFLMNLSSSVPDNALSSSMVWWSGIGDDTEWTPGIDTESANLYLNDTPGEITGARALGPNVIAYKEKATYAFEYVGGNIIWSARPTSKERGAISQEVIIDMGDAHAVMGHDDFYLVDASGAPQPIDNQFHDFLFLDNGTGHGDLDRRVQFAAQGRYDRARELAIWHYPSINLTENTTPQVCDRWVAWHRPTQRWTKGMLDVEQVLYPEMPSSLGVTYGDFGSIFAKWGDADDVPYDSYLFAGSSDVVPAIGGIDHALYTLDGTPADGAFFTLADWGDGQNFLFVRRHRPNFSVFPSELGTKLESTIKRILGASVERIGKTAYLDAGSGFVNFKDNAKLHGWKYTFPEGVQELDSIDVDYDLMGVR